MHIFRFSAANQILSHFLLTEGHKSLGGLRNQTSFLCVGHLHRGTSFIKLSYQLFSVLLTGERGPTCLVITYGPAAGGSGGAKAAKPPQPCQPTSPACRDLLLHPIFIELGNSFGHICCICQGLSFVKVLVVQCQHKYICP